MTDTNWPDPNRPGVPMFHERDGWHVMEGRVAGQTALTHWNGREWGGGEQVRALNTSPEWYRYVGPVLTPTQINEMLAAERERIKSMVVRACNAGNIINVLQRDMLIAGIDSETAIRNLGAAS
ncbi:hypothetical protein [Acetobacter oryzifermentans]|uniref:DUF4376 domain-containing protein n=1 Tax=Acetobacter oryzifermentans TaxID=1633874 RepID=A0ABN4NQK0_9PROT|nr:hypothetical protein [Acetobacter oryzifermentans]ANA14197.1 hypothetical protein WG31_09445 [Acetobacter oryzifermentans]